MIFPIPTGFIGIGTMGITGALAGCLEVPLLMWLRTVMNYQYRHGTPFGYSFRLLYAEGGIGRLYHGIGFTLATTSLARFGELQSLANSPARGGRGNPASLAPPRPRRGT